MNQTKKILIILAIIFSLGSVALDIYEIVAFFGMAYANRPAVFYLVFHFLELFASLSVAVLLIVAIWGNGKYFRQRYALYMTALIISIIINLFTVSTIFLIISMFISDIVWIKPEKDRVSSKNEGEVVVITPDDKEKRIASLRRQLESGEITYEKFQEELTKLL